LATHAISAFTVEFFVNQAFVIKSAHTSTVGLLLSIFNVCAAVFVVSRFQSVSSHL
jgi:hypothetical protein